jgi:hypothetical protein
VVQRARQAGEEADAGCLPCSLVQLQQCLAEAVVRQRIGMRLDAQVVAQIHDRAPAVQFILAERTVA